MPTKNTRKLVEAVSGGDTRLPNAIVLSETMTASDKLVYMVLKHHGFGGKLEVWPSQVRIAKLARMGRESVRASLRRFAEAGIASEAGRDGRNQVTYRLCPEADLTSALERLPDLTWNRQVTVQKPDLESPGNLTQNRQVTWPDSATNKQNISSISQEDCSAAPEGSSLSEGGMPANDEGLGNTRSAASPCEAVPQTDDGYDEPEASLPASPGPQHVASTEQSEDADWPNDSERPLRDVADDILDEVFGSGDTTPRWSAGAEQTWSPDRRPTKAQINEGFLYISESDSGWYRVSDDFDDLEETVNNQISEVCGEILKHSDLVELVAKHGVERCALWAHWLPRKIADEYERKKKSVSNPTGLYLKAVRGGERWKVDPHWPQFDEQLHTVAAREEFEKRQEARRGTGPESTPYTWGEVVAELDARNTNGDELPADVAVAIDDEDDDRFRF